MDSAAEVGRYLKDKLDQLKEKFPVIRDVRGLGLMIGLELANNDAHRTPNPDLRNRVVRKAFENGLLLLGCGDSAVRFCPPLVGTSKEVDVAVSIFRTVLEQLLDS